MAGFRVEVGGKLLAAVASEGFNIITVQVHGDVKGDELAVVDIFGGLYEGKESDCHLIWVQAHELKVGEELEIAFHEKIDASHPGQTVEEMYPEVEPETAHQQSMEELLSEIAAMPRLRERFTFELVSPSGDVFHSNTDPEEYSFHLGVMWRWVNPDEARVSLTSNSLDGIKGERIGRKHVGVSMQYGQRVKLRVGT